MKLGTTSNLTLIYGILLATRDSIYIRRIYRGFTLVPSNVASWEIHIMNVVLIGTIIEPSGGVSRKPCLITRGYH